MPGKIVLRPFELAFEDALALQLVELVDGKAKDLGGRVGASVGFRDDAARGLVGLEVGGRAVGQPALRAQNLLQSIGALAAENLHRLIHGEIVRVATGDPELSDANLGLHRIGPVDDDDALDGLRRLGGLERRRRPFRPVAEHLCQSGHRLIGVDIANHGNQRVVRAEIRPMDVGVVLSRAGAPSVP
jgi:hypothetical protein